MISSYAIIVIIRTHDAILSEDNGPCLDYCIKYGIQLNNEQNQKITFREQNKQITGHYSWDNITDYYQHVLRNPRIVEINTPKTNFQSNISNQHYQQIENQLIEHSQSNINNQNSQQLQQQNEYSQLAFQNQALITMMQTLSNNTSTIQDMLTNMLHHNNDTISNSQSQNSDINPQNTLQSLDSQINTTPPINAISNQRQESFYQINICDSCKRANFPDQELSSTSINQINICDSCMKNNFSN
ncbi:4644_t:CDS:2 [Gigaspora margarita]|uniref:4644_t:CDS:1 n=1 Tax=Gigaspora margarita TaxID=4874 RepID=A0ABM8W4Z7_GIGMA|nr:4644_t:CDS:2 [Gigaspora margarita]